MIESQFIIEAALLLEGEGSKGCLMAGLEAAEALPIREWVVDHVPSDVLVDSGREAEIHVTVAYGFVPGIDTREIMEAIGSFKKVDLTLGAISRFDTSPEYDVLKVDVESSDLKKMHEDLKKYFGERLQISYPTYIPHLTLAYIKKGALKELDGHAKFKGSVYRIRTLTYSTAGSKDKHYLQLVPADPVTV